MLNAKCKLCEVSLDRYNYRSAVQIDSFGPLCDSCIKTIIEDYYETYSSEIFEPRGRL